MFEKVRRSGYNLKDFRRRSAPNGEKKVRRGSVPGHGETSLPSFTASHVSVYCGFTRSVVCHVLKHGHIVSVCIVREDPSEIIAIKYQFPVFFSLILLQVICLFAILLPRLAIFLHI